MILCNARAMGEFGAVSVVSGHIRGETNTLPLHVEILYNEYNVPGGVRRRVAARVLAVWSRWCARPIVEQRNRQVMDAAVPVRAESEA